MIDRSENVHVFWPRPGGGQTVVIGPASLRSTPLTDYFGKKLHLWCTKACRIRVGTVAVVANQATDYPMSAGAVYAFVPEGSNSAYIAVIEDLTVAAAPNGNLFIGVCEQ